MVGTVLPVLVLTAWPPAASEVQGPPPPRIASVEVVAHEVFQADGDSLGAALGFANRLHLRTRERVVRRELLFEAGDPLDPELLAQTERNLRALPFLRDARVEVRPAKGTDADGRPLVHVRVLTWDTWSTVPELSLSKVGDQLRWSAGLSERNLLGLGKQLQVLRRANLEQVENLFFFRDPQLAGSRFVWSTDVAGGPNGSRAEISLERPFFSLETDWAFRASATCFDLLRPYSVRGGSGRGGSHPDRWRHVRRWTDLEISRALAKGSLEAWRFHVAYRQREDETEGDTRSFGLLEAGISAVEHRFVKLAHVNRFERPEDFNLGRVFSARLGVSTPALGGEEGTAVFASVSHRQGIQFSPGHFLLTTLSWRGRHRHGRLENSLAEVRLAYLRKHSERRVLLATMDLGYGHRLDLEERLFLGAESGLRGYPVRRWSGDRSLLLSVEERWFLADDVGQLLSLGVAAFLDSGFAWPDGEALDLGDLKTSVGVGLLLGRNRLSGSQPTLRFDLAYALDPADGSGRWQFFSGSGVTF